MANRAKGANPPNKEVQKINEAVLFYMAGKYADSAEAYLRAYKSVSVQLKYNCLSGFTSLLREETVKPTDAHMKFLKELKKDTTKPPAERILSAHTYGLMKYVVFGDRESAGKSYRLAVDVASTTPPQEYAKEVLMTNPSGAFTPTPVGPMIVEYSTGARDNLAVLTGQTEGRKLPPSRSNEPLPFWAASDGGPPIKRTFDMPMGSQAIPGRRSPQQLLDELLNVSGEMCDRCGAKRGDPAVTLKFCSKCKLMCYCGTECSRVAWQAGHKRTCRAPGEFKGGDYAQMHGLQSNPERNALVVQIHDRTDTGRWRVKIIGATEADPFLSVKEENLRNLRQPRM
mmetsp:Transcript_38699/g.65145  ORF Transcript_38699/g.65145 Transcript_38699/m.65145 type:complete len:341 (+) Transcript_38699:146-1168(+)